MRANHARGYLAKYSLLNVFKRMLLDRKFIGSYTGRWLEIYPHYLYGAAFGGLVGTVTGFAKFLQYQLRYKEGGGGGFHCMVRLYPKFGFGMVVMTNATGCKVRSLLDAVAPTFLGSRSNAGTATALHKSGRS